MIKQTLAVISLFSFAAAFAQNNTLIFKKKDKVLDNFWKGSVIAFQLKDKTWERGDVIKIQKDSIYIKPIMIQYSFMHADTLHSYVTGFSLKDIYAIPKPGVSIWYDKGSFKVDKRGSHVQAYWLKSGWILRVGALGFAALNIINGISQNDLSISNNGKQLSIAAAVLAAGVILNETYRQTLRLGKKYHLEVQYLSNQ
ncbi:MAG: hypothetical protein ABJA35_14325 [Parafilimonas sp.]